MKNERNMPVELVISKSNISFKQLYLKPYFPTELKSTLQNANLLLIPYEGFRTVKEPVFPEETMEFYHFITNYQDKSLVGDICIADEDYAELELHSNLITLANMIVSSAIYPIAISMIANYLDRKIFENGKEKELKVKVNITVDDGVKSKNINYEGRADEFEEIFKEYKKL